MKEQGIIFTGDSVPLILADLKGQTRRVLKPQPIIDGLYYEYKDIPWLKTGDPSPFIGHLCPYGQPGDRLWVRETWRAVELDNGNDGILYKADNHFKSIENSQAAADLWCDAYADRKYGNKWRPSIFMPRWASRILLEVTDVRVERVQEISDEDARKEGVQDICHCGDYIESHGYHSGHSPTPMDGYAANEFSILWDSINAKRGYPWESNPWVWVVGFKMVKP